MFEQSELTAVNSLLKAIGDVPVNSLTDTNPDVISARAVLNDQIAKVLAIGWWFNSDEGLTLVADETGIVRIPANTLQVDPSDTLSTLVRREDKLYDTATQTFYINENVDVDIIYYVELTDMPYTAYNAIVAKAAWEFGVEQELDTITNTYHEKEYNIAWRILQQSELSHRDVNILHSPRAQMALAGMPNRYRRS